MKFVAANEAESRLVEDIARAAAEAALSSLTLKVQLLPRSYQPAGLIAALGLVSGKGLAMVHVWPDLRATFVSAQNSEHEGSLASDDYRALAQEAAS